MLSADVDRIAHLRLHGVGDGARQRFAETLARVETLHPPDLPPGAVLLIRRLDVRWSTGDTPAVRGDRLRREVADLVPRAARPALGPVPADAPAVLFASRSELLACLALDALRGLDAWWWRLLDPPQSPARFAAAWLAAPELLPQILAWLAARGALVPILALLEQGQARTLAQALIHRLGLRDLAAPFTALPDALAPPPTAHLRPSWRAWAPELDDLTLPAPVQLFAALALTLQRAELHARSPGFAAAVHTWVVALAQPATTPTRPPRTPTPAETVATLALATPATILASPPSLPELSPAPSTLSLRANRPLDPPPFPAQAATLAAPPVVAEALAASVAPPPPQAASPSVVTRPDDLAIVPPGTALTRPATHDPISPPPQSATPHNPPQVRLHTLDTTVSLPLPTTLHTALGGSFYLLNLALALDLYGDFTRPLHRGLELSPWDFLAGLTARLLAAPAPPDPLWRLLAALAGRPALNLEPPPASLATPADFAAPGPADFDALELQLRDRLARTLELPAIWLHQPARVQLGEARLDIRYALADHPVELRVAGLDRDPGFIPAAGRDIRFWYDA